MNNDHSSQNNEATISINNEINAKVKHYKNVDQNFITITEDKMNLILIKHLNEIEDKKLWIAPLGIFITLLLIPLTTEKFKDAFSISASVWQAACYIAMVIFFIWFIILGLKSWAARKTTIESVINKLKQNSKNNEEEIK